MTITETNMISAFRKQYKDLCEGKDDDKVLLYIRFIEAGKIMINEELKREKIINDALTDALMDEQAVIMQ